MSRDKSDSGAEKAIIEKNNLISEAVSMFFYALEEIGLTGSVQQIFSIGNGRYQYNNPVYDTGTEVGGGGANTYEGEGSVTSINGTVTRLGSYGTVNAATPLAPRGPGESPAQDHYIYFNDRPPNNAQARKDPLPILHKVHFIQKRTCGIRRIFLLLIFLVLLLGIAIALYFIIDSFINKKRIPTDEKYNRLRGTVRILNMDYSDDYTNSNSAAYMFLSQDFNKELDSLFNNSSLSETFTSSGVVGFDRGSIITYFELVFDQLYTASDLEDQAKQVFLEDTSKSPSGDIYLGQYLIHTPSIQLEATYGVSDSSTTTTTTSTTTTSSSIFSTPPSSTTTSTTSSSGPSTFIPPVSTSTTTTRSTAGTPIITPSTTRSTTSAFYTGTTTAAKTTLFVPISTTLYVETDAPSTSTGIPGTGIFTTPGSTSTTTTTSPRTTGLPPHLTTPTPSHSTTSYIPVTCESVSVPYCQDPAQVTYTYTSFPNYIGQQRQSEATATFDSFVNLLSSGCHQDTNTFLCALLVPPCGRGGIANPPCRSFCRDFFQSCSDNLDPGLPFGIEDCDAFPDAEETDSCVAQPEAEMTALRLVPGAGQFEGRLEVKYNGEWGSICSSGWDDKDASVACRQLGYSDGGWARGGSYFGQADGEIWLSEVNCDGSEQDLATCEHDPWAQTGTCTHEQDIGVTCIDEHAVSTVDVRLEAGDDTAGRLEVFYDGEWGTVCSTGFDNDDATVVCKMLGYTENLGEVSALSSNPYGPGPDSMWLENVMCHGSESNIGFCEHNGWGKANCLNGEPVAISCVKQVLNPPLRLMDGPDNQSGRVEVLYNGQWGTVCDERLHDGTAQVICRTLGFWGEALQMAPGTYGPGTGPIWQSGLECMGNESSIYDCTWDGWGSSNCVHSQDAAVACSYAAWQRLRLVDQVSHSDGRLEVLIDGTWGTVCSNYFGDDDATVACQTMGYDAPGRTLFRSSDAPDSQPIWMTNVNCSGNPASFFDCSYDDATVVSTATCNHPDNDVYMACAANDAQFRLRDGVNSMEGRLEVFYNYQWGTVCDDYFNHDAAVVACRTLGLGASDVQYLGNYYGPGSGPIWLESVQCFGVESYLTDCRHEIWGVHNCAHQEDVSIRCGYAPTPTFQPPISTPGIPSCEPLITPVCADNLPYGVTLMPNLLGHQSQEEAEEAFLTNNWHHPLTLCPLDMLYFTCSFLYPECTANNTILNPCRSVCERAKTSCLATMEAEGYQWPDAFNCAMLPTDNCFDPQGLATVPPEQGECEEITIPICSLDTSYTLTHMPNLLGQATQAEASQSSFTQWTGPISFACHPLIRPFLCSMYAPQCLPGFEEVEPLKPCRSVCYAVKASCEVDLMGQPWPAEFACDNFPDDPTGEQCLLLEPPELTSTTPGMLPNTSVIITGSSIGTGSGHTTEQLVTIWPDSTGTTTGRHTPVISAGTTTKEADTSNTPATENTDLPSSTTDRDTGPPSKTSTTERVGGETGLSTDWPSTGEGTGPPSGSTSTTARMTSSSTAGTLPPGVPTIGTSPPLSGSSTTMPTRGTGSPIEGASSSSTSSSSTRGTLPPISLPTTESVTQRTGSPGEVPTRETLPPFASSSTESNTLNTKPPTGDPSTRGTTPPSVGPSTESVTGNTEQPINGSSTRGTLPPFDSSTTESVTENTGPPLSESTSGTVPPFAGSSTDSSTGHTGPPLDGSSIAGTMPPFVGSSTELPTAHTGPPSKGTSGTLPSSAGSSTDSPTGHTGPPVDGLSTVGTVPPFAGSSTDSPTGHTGHPSMGTSATETVPPFVESSPKITSPPEGLLTTLPTVGTLPPIQVSPTTLSTRATVPPTGASSTILHTGDSNSPSEGLFTESVTSPTIHPISASSTVLPTLPVDGLSPESSTRGTLPPIEGSSTTLPSRGTAPPITESSTTLPTRGTVPPVGGSPTESSPAQTMLPSNVTSTSLPTMATDLPVDQSTTDLPTLRTLPPLGNTPTGLPVTDIVSSDSTTLPSRNTEPPTSGSSKGTLPPMTESSTTLPPLAGLSPIAWTLTTMAINELGPHSPASSSSSGSNTGNTVPPSSGSSTTLHTGDMALPIGGPARGTVFPGEDFSTPLIETVPPLPDSSTKLVTGLPEIDSSPSSEGTTLLLPTTMMQESREPTTSKASSDTTIIRGESPATKLQSITTKQPSLVTMPPLRTVAPKLEIESSATSLLSTSLMSTSLDSLEHGRWTKPPVNETAESGPSVSETTLMQTTIKLPNSTGAEMGPGGSKGEMPTTIPTGAPAIQSTMPAARCELIQQPECSTSKVPNFYNYTMLPNTFGWSTPQEVLANSQQYVALSDMPCSRYQMEFVCAALYPRCDVINGVSVQVKLCRSLCKRVQSACLPLLEDFGLDWPEEVSCDIFTDDEPCYNPLT